MTLQVNLSGSRDESLKKIRLQKINDETTHNFYRITRGFENEQIYTTPVRRKHFTLWLYGIKVFDECSRTLTRNTAGGNTATSGAVARKAHFKGDSGMGNTTWNQ
jgi:hypothetical protein